MARFFIVTINYAPEPSGFAPYAAAFAERLAQHGHQVSVFTGFPFAPRWRRRDEDRGRFFAREQAGNVIVSRLTHYIPRRPSSALQRMAMEGSFSVVGLVAMLGTIMASGRPDAVVYIGAQPALAMLARVVAVLVHRPYFVRITDLAARAALDVGIVGGRLSRLLEKFELAAYKKAAGAMVLCRSFEDDLVKCGYPQNRIRVIANPIDLDQVRPIPRDNRFRVRYRIPHDAFLVMHAGSMGLKQGLLTVVAAASLARSTTIHWVFVGDGEVRPDLVEAARARGLEDVVHFVPFQQEDELSAMFAAADVLLVNQIRAVKDTLIPGKLLTYMAAGRPVIVAANPHSQAAQLLQEADGGILIAPEDPEALTAAVQRFAATDAETLASLGARNRAYAECHFDQNAVLHAQEEFMIETMASGPVPQTAG